MKDNNNLSDFDYQSFEKQAIEDLYKGKNLLGDGGILSPLIQRLVHEALQGELDIHLGHDKNKKSKSGNTRNGSMSKKVKSSYGMLDISTPRDREGSFEPQIIKKRQTALNEEIDNKILSLYALGNSYQDISKHIQELYGIDVSTGSMTEITNRILPLITEWQSRSLDEVYPIIFMDALYFKVRDNGVVVNKAVHIVLGINMEGRKEVLGFYIGGNEGAKFWLEILGDLSNRGVKDILIASIDNLKGFKEAIESIYKETEVQLCIIHQIRNSLKYVSWKDRKSLMASLKKVYKALTKEKADMELDNFEKEWGEKYPLVVKSWQNNWEELSTYFKYPQEIRRLIYTTNAIEGLNSQIRKFTKRKRTFTNEVSLSKMIYLSLDNISKKWTQPIPHWSLMLSQLSIFFGERVKIDLRY